MSRTERDPPEREAQHGTPTAVLLSLADFAKAGLRPRTALGRAIVLALLVKLVVIISMKVFWFSGDARPPVDAAAIARVIGVGAGAPQ